MTEPDANVTPEFVRIAEQMPINEREMLGLSGRLIPIRKAPDSNDGPLGHRPSADVIQSGRFSFPEPIHWPSDLPPQVLQFHMHLKELVESWRIDVRRTNDQSANIFFVSETAEANGVTAVESDSHGDLTNFLDTNSLQDFVIRRGHLSEDEAKLSGRDYESIYYATLNNKFGVRELTHFFEKLNKCVNELANIASERENAIRIESGRIGIITTSFFHERERIILNRIRNARFGLVR